MNQRFLNFVRRGRAQRAHRLLGRFLWWGSPPSPPASLSMEAENRGRKRAARRDRRVRLLGQIHRPATVGSGPRSPHLDQLAGSPKSLRQGGPGGALPFRPARAARRVAPRRGRALQYLLGPLQSPRVPLRRRGPQHAGALRCGPAGGRAADRPREHHQPLGRLAAGVFPRQGPTGTSARKSWASLTPFFARHCSSARKTF